MKALLVNCTLKRQPDFSNTGALAEKAVKLLQQQGFETENIRLNDYNILTWNSSDEGDGDQWPLILEKIKAQCQYLHFMRTGRKKPERGRKKYS